jgi:D-alanine transaminase
MTQQAWLNGVYIAAEEARISPFDRGFLFADGVYEVTAVYGGQLIDMERHLDRLERSLRELKFGTMPDRKELEEVHRKLVAGNSVDEGYVYLQVTRGAYGARDFVAPETPRLTIFMFAEKRALIDTPSARNGSRIVTLPDIRWARRDIKSVGLLAQAMAKTEAKARGADDAWLVAPDGFVTEGASSNAWIVTKDGEIITRALSNMILAGVTRHALFDSLGQKGIKLIERNFTVEEARSAAEAFTTAATGLVTPVVEIDGVELSDGKPGPLTRSVQKAYYTAIGADVAKAAPWLAG